MAVVCTSLIAAQAEICRATDAPRASSRPRRGALSACVRGTPKRAGPMIATVWSIAAIAAPYPVRRPRCCPDRASATPPASATQKPADGAAREARNEAVATWARPDGDEPPRSGPAPLAKVGVVVELSTSRDCSRSGGTARLLEALA